MILQKIRAVLQNVTSENLKLIHFGWGLLIGLIIFAITIPLKNYLDIEIIYLYLLSSTIVSAWFFGFGPGLLTTEVIAVLIWFQFYNPISALAFLVFGMMVSFLASLRKIEEDKLRAKEEYFRNIVEKEKEARRLAEEAVKTRDEFLSIASHELKTPLTTILLQLQSTLDAILNQSLANFSGEKLVKSLTNAQQQSNRMQKLIKDLLNVSLISTGKLDLELKETDLSKIVENTISRFDDQAMMEGSTINFQPNGEIKGLWDDIRMEQAITNLITNAIKYGGGKPIKVTVDKNHNHARISIADQGLGIEPKKQQVIFDRFKRAVDGNKYQGLGVGLFIVKQIVESHGGQVTVDSKPNNGSTFTIELPIKNN